MPLAVEAEVIRTGRLTLLPLLVEHAEELAAALSDPDLHTFIGGAPATPEALRTRHERLVSRLARPRRHLVQLGDPAPRSGLPGRHGPGDGHRRGERKGR